jgi:hypothetical protein
VLLAPAAPHDVPDAGIAVVTRADEEAHLLAVDPEVEISLDAGRAGRRELLPMARSRHDDRPVRKCSVE